MSSGDMRVLSGIKKNLLPRTGKRFSNKQTETEALWSYNPLSYFPCQPLWTDLKASLG
jgi:hypothetical protein